MPVCARSSVFINRVLTIAVAIYPSLLHFINLFEFIPLLHSFSACLKHHRTSADTDRISIELEAEILTSQLGYAPTTNDFKVYHRILNPRIFSST